MRMHPKSVQIPGNLST